MKLKSTFLCPLFLSLLNSYGQAPVITAQVSPSSFCTGDIIQVSFATSDTFIYDNIFTIELSDSSGDFTSATLLDTVNNQSGDTLYIPAPAVVYGTHYRIRVTASNPGADDTAANDLTLRVLLPAPNAQLTVVGNSSFCTGDSAIVKLDSLSELSTKWWFNGQLISTPDRFNALAKDSGLYLVQFTDTVTLGCSTGFDSVVIAVHGYPATPVITAGGSTTFCSGQSVTLSVPVNASLTYQWTKNGNIIPAETTESYEADSAGTYRIEVASFTCSAVSDTVTITVNESPAKPVVAASGSTTFCEGDSVTLSVPVNASLTYQWIMDGNNIPGDTTESYVADSLAEYRIAVTNSFACTSVSDSVDIVTHAYPAKPVITASDTTAICVNGSVTLSVPVNALFTYEWTKDTTVISGATTESYVADTAGSYRIKVSNFTCSTVSDTIAVTILPAAGVTFTVTVFNSCLQSPPFPLTGGLPSGGFYSDSNSYVAGNLFYPNLSGIGTYNVYYTYTDSFGCITKVGAPIQITSCGIPSVASQVSTSTFCPGETMTVSLVTSDAFFFNNIFTIQLSDTAGSFANPTVLDTVQAQIGGTILVPVPVVTGGTNYKLRVVTSSPAVNGIATGSIHIREQLPPPNVQLTALNTSLCFGDSVKLKVDSLSALSTKWWRNDTAFSTPNRFYTYAKDSGLYIVKFTDTVTTGCSAGYDTLLIAVHGNPVKPVITASGATEICGTGSVTLSVPQVASVTYLWTNGGNTIPGATARSYTTTSTGQFKATVKNTFGCPAVSDLVKVTINAKPVVTFNLALDSFCLNSPPIHLEGGLPAGGHYSGNNVSTTTFYQSASGLGTFKVYYTYADSIGCNNTDSAQLTIFNCTTSGINDLSRDNLFEMYPNPASDDVTFETGKSTNCHVRILTLLGEEILQATFNQQMSCSAKDLSAGTYLVEITDFSSGIKSVKRLIKQ